MESAEMPEKDSTVQYVNFRKQLQLLFVISTDFEAIMPKLQRSDRDSDENKIISIVAMVTKVSVLL